MGGAGAADLRRQFGHAVDRAAGRVKRQDDGLATFIGDAAVEVGCDPAAPAAAYAFKTIIGGQIRELIPFEPGSVQIYPVTALEPWSQNQNESPS